MKTTITFLLITVLFLLSSVFAIHLEHFQTVETCQNILLTKKYIYRSLDLTRFSSEAVNYKDNIYHVVITSTDKVYYRYHSNQAYPIGRDYTWLSDRKYKSDQEIRQNLAILPSWNNLDYLSEIKVPAGTEMAIGIVGPQTCPNPKECNGKTGYPGGGLQVLINSLYLDKNMVLSTIKRH